MTLFVPDTDREFRKWTAPSPAAAPPAAERRQGLDLKLHMAVLRSRLVRAGGYVASRYHRRQRTGRRRSRTRLSFFETVADGSL